MVEYQQTSNTPVPTQPTQPTQPSSQTTKQELAQLAEDSVEAMTSELHAGIAAHQGQLGAQRFWIWLCQMREEDSFGVGTLENDVRLLCPAAQATGSAKANNVVRLAMY